MYQRWICLYDDEKTIQKPYRNHTDNLQSYRDKGTKKIPPAVMEGVSFRLCAKSTRDIISVQCVFPASE